MNDKEKTLQIETGVFWICFKGENADFICDKGRFVKCGGKRIVEKITKDEDGLNYKYSHKKAWEELSKTAAEGRICVQRFSARQNLVRYRGTPPLRNVRRKIVARGENRGRGNQKEFSFDRSRIYDRFNVV